MNVLSPAIQRHVEDRLVKEGYITAPQLALLKNEAAKNGQPILSFLITQGHINDEQLTKTLAQVSKVPYVNLGSVRIDPKVLELLPQEVARQYMAVPLGEMQNRLVVAMLDADNVQAVDFLSNKIGRPLKVYVASESGIRRVLEQYAHVLEQGVNSMLADREEIVDEDLQPAGRAEKKVQVLVQDSPISKALSAIMEYAAKNRASDIHIEPMEKELKIRCRIDGVLREVMKLPKSNEPALVSRVKILSNLKIDEHRVPQDGQFSIKVDGRSLDLRIAISPVVWGEQVVIRLLDKTGTSLKLEDMGYTGRTLRIIREGLKRSNGMVLTSGPTGSGKTTSMYAMVSEVKSEMVNIVTLEDPVEYKIEGVNQIQVNPDVGLTFATGLRAILRQDPDIVMVGEIRDKETAQLAVQAALTGHLVFATLHTNNAAGILPRLLDMGIEPFLIASTVHTVIGQRLVRRIVPGGETYEASKAEVQAIGETIGSILPKTTADVDEVSDELGFQNLPPAGQNAYTLIEGKKTPDNPTGYQGRIGIYEVFEVTEQIQELILKRSTSSEIQKLAQSQGMISMRQDGYLKALSGLTSLNEVNRVASDDNPEYREEVAEEDAAKTKN